MLCHFCKRKLSRAARRHIDLVQRATVRFFRSERCSDEEIAAYLQIDVSRVRCL